MRENDEVFLLKTDEEVKINLELQALCFDSDNTVEKRIFSPKKYKNN